MPENQPIRPRLSALEIGESATFPSGRHGSVRTSAYSLSLETGKTFSTRIDRPRGTLTVTRTA